MPTVDKVIDLSHHNAPVDFAKVKKAGILGVIHKATEGATVQDPKYAERTTAAAAAGLFWGAYHFGNNRDAVKQADNFLATVQPTAGELIALDIEENKGNEMSLAQAVTFVNRIHEKTGRWPGIYAGSYLRSVLPAAGDETLKKCWLWIAQYANAPKLLPGWTRWTMWQYTDGTAGPNPVPVPGVGKCDRDQFNGTEAELRAHWGQT